MDYLYERLHVEEARQVRLQSERASRDRLRKTGSNYDNTTSRTAGRGSYRMPKREDKSHLKCTFTGCGKTSHTEETCWTKDPSKAPRSLKDKLNSTAGHKHSRTVSANAETNLATFRDAYSSADDLGIPSTHAPQPNVADTSPQTRSVAISKRLQRSGGVGINVPGLRETGLSRNTLGAFLLGLSCTPDTWLADTGANMHIVNDMK